VQHKLPGLGTGRGETQPIHDVVQTALQKAEEIVAGLSGHAQGLLIRQVELPFHKAVYPFELLLFPELDRVIGHLAGSGLGVLAGRGALAVDRAFIAFAALALEEELFPLGAAEPASGSV
jgi:hypothetical protein